jgi:YD repeat-containing protein
MRMLFLKVLLSMFLIWSYRSEGQCMPPPVSIYSVYATDIGGCPCQTPLFGVVMNNPTPVNITWKFGDGNTTTMTGVVTSTTTMHIYTTPGNYTVWVVISGGGCQDSASIYQPITCWQNNGCPSIAFFSHTVVPSQDPCSYFEFNMGLCGDTGMFSPVSHPIPFTWDFGDGVQQLDTVYLVNQATNHLYGAPGIYTACITVDTGMCTATRCHTVNASCVPPPCTDCISSFAPIPGKRYLISAWVKENNPPQPKTSYNYPSITITYPSIPSQIGPFYATGNIIDGWQRLEAGFTIPPGATNMGIKLDCASGSCFFDDIRVQPFDGSMKSYVYDPVNMRLVAELDERNYATKYEYDEEGKLIRVKKETEKGIMTIKENRSNTQKN